MLHLPNAYLVSEAAEMLGCHYETLRREIKRGAIEAHPRKGTVKPLYIGADELQRYQQEVLRSD